MKHELIERGDQIEFSGDTRDLRRCLWLTRMNSATRTATLASLATLCAATGIQDDLAVEQIRAMIGAPDPSVKGKVGTRWSQVASDMRRALRTWEDLPTRWLALRLRDRIPTLADAAAAASLRLGADEARRATLALEALARAEGGLPEDMPATLATIEPILRAATPETFGVASVKSLENKKTLIRKVARLVDPLASGMRKTSVAALPTAWQDALFLVGKTLKDHEASASAILRRLAVICAGQGRAPSSIDDALMEAFVKIELATHAPGYQEKLRAAFRRWNDVAEMLGTLPVLTPPCAPTQRQAEVAWLDVPPGIREPLDALLETAVSARHPGDWSDFVPDMDPDYADLGIAFVVPDRAGSGDANIILEGGTHGNWRDAIKRAWHAAWLDARVEPKPAVLGDLYAQSVVAALVAAVRRSRRDRLEAQGQVFDPKEKGRYEHSLVEALETVGRHLGVDPAKLELVKGLKLQIDPNVTATRLQADGSLKRVYADRRIGKRHASMLAAFSDTSRLKRWFEAPVVLWHLACKPIAAGRKPAMIHVALARSALIARIGQYVAPIRRTNFARLRYRGDDRHLFLPVGDGVGTLRIPANEGKTLRELHVEIDRETVRMLKYYIRHFLPVAQKHAKASADNPHLYPGAGGSKIEDGGYAPGRGFHTKEKLNTTFKKHLGKHCKIDLCLHVMRHLAGKIILDQDPSAMALVQEILGHKRLRTTQAYYAEVSKIIAQRRYIHLLERQSRQVLANVKFRFIDPNSGKEIRHAKA